MVVLRTFSKIHGLAGARVGYGMAHPDVIEALEKVRSPFNTSSIGQLGAIGALEDPEHASRSRHENRRELDRLQDAFRHRGIDFIPSSTNFVLARPGFPGKEAYASLLREGVIVRPMAGYGFPDHLRISVGTPGEDDRLLQALHKVRADRGLDAA